MRVLGLAHRSTDQFGTAAPAGIDGIFDVGSQRPAAVENHAACANRAGHHQRWQTRSGCGCLMAHWLGVDDHFVNFCLLLPGVKDFCALHTRRCTAAFMRGLGPQSIATPNQPIPPDADIQCRRLSYSPSRCRSDCMTRLPPVPTIQANSSSKKRENPGVSSAAVETVQRVRLSNSAASRLRSSATSTG